MRMSWSQSMKDKLMRKAQNISICLEPAVYNKIFRQNFDCQQKSNGVFECYDSRLTSQLNIINYFLMNFSLIVKQDEFSTGISLRLDFDLLVYKIQCVNAWIIENCIIGKDDSIELIKHNRNKQNSRHVNNLITTNYSETISAPINHFYFSFSTFV